MHLNSKIDRVMAVDTKEGIGVEGRRRGLYQQSHSTEPTGDGQNLKLTQLLDKPVDCTSIFNVCLSDLRPK